MKFTKRFLILFLFISSSILSQTIDKTIDLAKIQRRIGNIDNAILLWKRICLFSYSDTFVFSQMNLGDCYFLKGEFQQSLECYNLAIDSTKNDSIYNELLCRISTSYLFQNEFVEDKSAIDRMRYLDSEYFQGKRNLHLGYIAFLGFDFKTSKQYLTYVIENTCNKYKGELDLIYNKTNRINKLKNSKKWMLSFLIPGSGQLSQGDYRNGINSLMLNGGLSILTIYIGINYGIPDAALSIMPWWYRYYTGSIEKSRELSKDRVKEAHFQVFLELLNLCEECIEEDGRV